MHDGEIDYSKYGLRQLSEALSGINREKYPKNYSNLCFAYQRITGKLPSEDVKELFEAANFEGYSKPKSKRDKDSHYAERSNLANVQFTNYLILPVWILGITTLAMQFHWVNIVILSHILLRIYLDKDPFQLRATGGYVKSVVIFAMPAWIILVIFFAALGIGLDSWIGLIATAVYGGLSLAATLICRPISRA